MSARLITPHGDSLQQLIAEPALIQALQQEAASLPNKSLSARQLCDIELLLNGAFSPLHGFMTRADYEPCLEEMRLANNTLWPIPIVLDCSEEEAKGFTLGQKIALRCPQGLLLAIMNVEDIWQPDKQPEAQAVYGTISEEHPGVHALMHSVQDWYIGGRVTGVQLPLHYDFQHLRLTPLETRQRFAEAGASRVVAFQTRNPMHRAHKELTVRAARDADARLLLHPVVGQTRPGDIDYVTRVRCYQALLPYYTDCQVDLALLPLSMRMAGPREALWHAIIRKNYGCSHLIIGRDHAAPAPMKDGTPFYGPYDAHELMQEHGKELGIEPLMFEEIVYVKNKDAFFLKKEAPKDAEIENLSGTELRRRLRSGEPIPAWFSYGDVISELRHRYPPRNKAGFVLFFTGLSGAGKSTLAKYLTAKLQELDPRAVNLLDGDEVRHHLSSELGFSREHRDLNVLRIAYVASLIAKSGGIAICAPIAPYEATRQQAKQIAENYGGFHVIHVSTPLEVCEERDVKGLYAKARAGTIPQFTGISDPYEVPVDPDLRIDTSNTTPHQAVNQLLDLLVKEGYLHESATTQNGQASSQNSVSPLPADPTLS